MSHGLDGYVFIIGYFNGFEKLCYSQFFLLSHVKVLAHFYYLFSNSTIISIRRSLVIIIYPSRVRFADSIRKAPVASKRMAGAKSDIKAGQVATHLLAGPVPLSDLLLIY